MKRYLAALSAFAFLAGAGIAVAEEATGKIQAVDETTRTITLEDGTTYTVAEGVSLEGLESGKEVTVSFDEEGGQNVAKEIKTME